MAITALPTPPSRDDAVNFAARADAFLGALPTFGTEANALATQVSTDAASAASSAASAVNAPGSNGTSSTSVTIGLGDKTLTIQTSKAFVKGQWVQVASSANVLNYMIGPIKSYDSVTGIMVVTVQRTGGSGTFTDWVVSLGGAVLSDSTPRNLAAGSTVKDAAGTDRFIGFKGMPTKTISTSYTVTVDDVGCLLEIAAGGALILPRNSTLGAGSQFQAGDTIVWQEVANATKSLSPAASTNLYQSGTSLTGTRTIKARGFGSATVSGALTDTWFCRGDLT